MKAIYKPKGKAGEYAKYAVNFYTGCSNDCEYCFCKRGVMATIWSDKPKLKKCFKDEQDAYRVFCLEVDRLDEVLKKEGLFLSFTTDPCLPDTVELTRCAVSYAVSRDIPIQILTKVASEELYTGLEYYAQWMNDPLPKIAVGFTLTGHDELEPKASTNGERIKMMRKIHDLGFKTFASMEPIIDVQSSIRVINETLGFCNLYKIGLRSGVSKDYYNDIGLRCFYSFLKGLAYKKAHCRIYLKDSVVERIGIDRSTLPNVFVNSDFNLFKDE